MNAKAENLRQLAEVLARHWQKGEREYVWAAILLEPKEDACALALYISRLITDEEKTAFLNYFIEGATGEVHMIRWWEK